MNILKDLISLGLTIIPPLLAGKEKAKAIQIDRIRRAQDRLLAKRLDIESKLREGK
jgi:hypothetical protein